MKTYKCQNLLDYDDESEDSHDPVDKEGEICTTCAEKMYEIHLNDYYGGSGPRNMRELQEQARKQSKGIAEQLNSIGIVVSDGKIRKEDADRAVSYLVATRLRAPKT